MSDVQIATLDIDSVDFNKELDALLEWEAVSDHNVEAVVAEIIAQTKKRGDQAVLEYTRKFDKLNSTNISQLVVHEEELKAAYEEIDSDVQNALKIASSRIRKFHEHQISVSWQYEEDGVILGQKVTPLDRVGIYVPGGTASYPSSVLMNAIPASVAGVEIGRAHV